MINEKSPAELTRGSTLLPLASYCTYTHVHAHFLLPSPLHSSGSSSSTQRFTSRPLTASFSTGSRSIEAPEKNVRTAGHHHHHPLPFLSLQSIVKPGRSLINYLVRILTCSHHTSLSVRQTGKIKINFLLTSSQRHTHTNRGNPGRFPPVKPRGVFDKKLEPDSPPPLQLS